VPFRGPRSLRGRLLSATLVLAAIGLAVAGASTYHFLESFLLRRVDQQLAVAAQPGGPIDRDLDTAHGLGGGFGRGPSGAGVPPGTWAAFLDLQGQPIPPVAHYLGYGYDSRHVPGPKLPARWPGTWPASGQAGTPARFLTAPAQNGASITYRVVAEPLVDEQASIVVAVPLSDVSATLHRLLLVEILVALAVLAGLGALAWWLVRLGLRPLEAIGDTAGAIAAGDLSRRVDPAEPTTEVGRLGLSLNVMLGQIEESFERQRATEERLRRFVADASHELRTPLTSIRGYAELFRRGAATRPEDLAKAMDRIEAEASRMGVLVEDLLLLARLDQGLPLVFDSVDLSGVARRAVEDARAADPGRPLSFDGDGPLVVSGDEVRLRQIMDNLLANVRVHTPAGTPARVGVSREDGRALVDVADEGPGVSLHETSRIFERFYRSDAGRSREMGGAGLGLAIAAEIARAHGGSLELVPSESGATFRLSLPVPTSGTAPARPDTD